MPLVWLRLRHRVRSRMLPLHDGIGSPRTGDNVDQAGFLKNALFLIASIYPGQEIVEQKPLAVVRAIEMLLVLDGINSITLQLSQPSEQVFNARRMPFTPGLACIQPSSSNWTRMARHSSNDQQRAVQCVDRLPIGCTVSFYRSW